MKKIRAWVFAVLMAVVLCACGEEQELADISTAEGDGYVAIIWEERTYVPFCVVSKNDCGTLIGYRDGDTDDRVCEYKDYLSNEWIANYLTVDGGAMLYKEINVTNFSEDNLTNNIGRFRIYGTVRGRIAADRGTTKSKGRKA